MNLSLKLILAIWLLSIAMISTSEAGKFGSLHSNSGLPKMSSNSFSSRNISSNKMSNAISHNAFKNMTTKSPVNSNFGQNFNHTRTLNNSNSFKNLTPVTKSGNGINSNLTKIGKLPVNGVNLNQRTHSPMIGGAKKLPGLVLQPRNPLPGSGLPLNPLPGGNKPPFNPFPGGTLPPINPGAGGKKPPFNPFPGGTLPPINPGGGGKKPPFNPFPGGTLPPIDPGTGGGNPPMNPNPGGGNPPSNPNPPYCPPHCPSWCCPPGYWPRPIFLPSFNLYPPVYQPCVTTVCPSVVNQTVIADAPVQQAAAEPVQPALQLMVGKPASLEAQGLGDVAGSVVIEVGGIGLPTQVRSWTDKMLVIDVPAMGLNGPTPATMHLFDSNGKPLASIPVELIVPVETVPAVSSK